MNSEEKLEDKPSKTVITDSASTAGDKNIRVFFFLILKRVILIQAIYFVGYMNWSSTWLITPMVLFETRKFFRSNNDVKREIVKASTKGKEKDVILTRVEDLPSWVYFPDFERCEFVNQIVAQIWPNSHEFTRNLIKNKLEPKIRKALSKSKLKLSGFEFDSNRICLGATPPRIGGIKVYDKNTSRDEIIIDMDVNFASDCNIKFRLSKLSAAFKDFEIYGRIRIILKPVMPLMPFVGGLQIFFLNKPEIDFNLGKIDDLIIGPALNDILRHVIAKKIAKKMVSPNKISIALSKKIPSTVLKMPEPEGVLRIHVVEARDLVARDFDGASDPYTVITIGAQEFQTRKIYNNLNPKWDFYCEACIDDKQARQIKFSLYDWDRASSPERLGGASVEIGLVMQKGTLDTWLPLEGVQHGHVHVILTWFELSSAIADLTAALTETALLSGKNVSTAILCVYLDSASDLPETETQSDPFVILKVGNSERLSSAKKETDAPVWEQGFTFLCPNPESDTLRVRVVGKRSGKDGLELGHFTFPINELLTQNDLQIILQSFHLRNSDPSSKVTMSLALKFLKRSKILSNGTYPPVEVPVTQTQQLRIADPEEIEESEELENLELPKSDSTTSSEEDSSPHPSEQLQEKTHFSVASYGLARIQITLFYFTKLEVLSVTVHRINNIPMEDPSHAPSPYVKLYLLPGRSKKMKRKTHTIKDSCDPIYTEKFEYEMALSVLKTTDLEVIVKTKKERLFGKSSGSIGTVIINLKKEDIMDKESTKFYDLSQEAKVH